MSSPLSVSPNPSPIPAALPNALRDLSWDNEKLKYDGFNYNLYFHLAINYLLLIGGTSLSPNTSSREKFSPGEQLVPESCTRMGFQSPRSWQEKGESGCGIGAGSVAFRDCPGTHQWVGLLSAHLCQERSKEISPFSYPYASVGTAQGLTQTTKLKLSLLVTQSPVSLC